MLSRDFLSALFYPALAFPQKQFEIHEGTEADRRYILEHRQIWVFFVARPALSRAGHIFVECKNYGKEVGNPELDQLSSRFRPNEGMSSASWWFDLSKIAS